MDLATLQLHRGNRGAGVSDHEIKLLGQTVGGDLLDIHTVQNTDNALEPQLVADVGLHGNVLALLHQGIRCGGNDQDTADLRNLGIFQSLRTLKDLGVDVLGGQFHSFGLVASILAHNAVGVGVNLGDDHFPVLTGQSGSSGQLAGGFVLVQGIDSEGEGTILLQGHFLGVGIQTLNSTVPAPVAFSRAGATIVIHLGSRDLVHLDGVRTVPVEILVGQQGALGLSLKLFVSMGLKFGSQINCHFFVQITAE